MINAGRLNEEIEITRASQLQNDSGGFEWVSEPILSTFASVKELSVSNDLIAQQENIIQSFEFKIRYRQDVHIKIGDKLQWRGRELHIQGFKGGMLNRAWISIIARTDNETTNNGEVYPES